MVKRFTKECLLFLGAFIFVDYPYKSEDDGPEDKVEQEDIPATFHFYGQKRNWIILVGKTSELVTTNETNHQVKGRHDEGENVEDTTLNVGLFLSNEIIEVFRAVPHLLIELIDLHLFS